MEYKNNYLFQMILRSILLIANIFLVVLLSFSDEWFFSCLFLSALIVLQIYLLVTYLNKTNRDLARFMLHLQESDTSIYFDTKSLEKKFKGLSNAFYQVNKKYSEIKKLEHQKEIRLQIILDQVNTGVLVINEKDEIYLANKAFYNLFRLSNQNSINKTLLEKEIPELLEILRKSKQRKTYISPSGEQILINCQILKEEGNSLKIYSFQDIAIEMNQKELDSWNGLIRVLMHETMNTLTPMSTVVDTALECIFKNDNIISKEEISQKDINDTAKSLQIINNRIEGLTSFVKRFRQFAHIPKPMLEKLNLKQLIDNVLILFQHEFKGEIINQVGENSYIQADKHLMEHVLINLIKNAIEATNHENKPRITISYLNDNNKKVLRITDNGCGISSDIKNKIFIPFFTTKESGGGVGLSLSRQIINLHGGDLIISSGNGTTEVSLWLDS